MTRKPKSDRQADQQRHQLWVELKEGSDAQQYDPEELAEIERLLRESDTDPDRSRHTPFEPAEGEERSPAEYSLYDASGGRREVAPPRRAHCAKQDRPGYVDLKDAWNHEAHTPPGARYGTVVLPNGFQWHVSDAYFVLCRMLAHPKRLRSAKDIAEEMGWSTRQVQRIIGKLAQLADGSAPWLRRWQALEELADETLVSCVPPGLHKGDLNGRPCWFRWVQVPGLPDGHHTKEPVKWLDDCEHCGKQIPNWRANKKYCSTACGNAARQARHRKNPPTP